MAFDSCYANQLGLSTTVDPKGAVQMCCQYYQRTLGSVGTLSEKLRFIPIADGNERLQALSKAPRDHCDDCSPSDHFVNRFVQFLKDAHAEDAKLRLQSGVVDPILDPPFLDWAENEIQMIPKLFPKLFPECQPKLIRG